MAGNIEISGMGEQAFWKEEGIIRKKKRLFVKLHQESIEGTVWVVLDEKAASFIHKNIHEGPVAAEMYPMERFARMKAQIEFGNPDQ